MSSASAAGATISGGTVTAGNTPGAADLVVYQNSASQSLTISSVIANNATAVTPVSVALAASTIQQAFATATVAALYPGMGISATGGKGSHCGKN